MNYVRWTVLLWMMVAGVGCRGLGGGAEGHCLELQRGYWAYGAVVVAASAVTGSSAIATTAPEDADVRLVLGVSTAVAAGVGAAAVYLRDELVKEYDDTCRPTHTSSTSDR